MRRLRSGPAQSRPASRNFGSGSTVGERNYCLSLRSCCHSDGTASITIKGIINQHSRLMPLPVVLQSSAATAGWLECARSDRAQTPSCRMRLVGRLIGVALTADLSDSAPECAALVAADSPGVGGCGLGRMTATGLGCGATPPSCLSETVAKSRGCCLPAAPAGVDTARALSLPCAVLRPTALCRSAPRLLLFLSAGLQHFSRAPAVPEPRSIRVCSTTRKGISLWKQQETLSLVQEERKGETAFLVRRSDCGDCQWRDAREGLCPPAGW